MSFNTAASFATNTNWQGYGGEVTMSYLTPDGLGLTASELRLAAGGHGHARCIAVIRGFAWLTIRTNGLGNLLPCRSDARHSAVWVLLPILRWLPGGLLLVSAGRTEQTIFQPL